MVKRYWRGDDLMLWDAGLVGRGGCCVRCGFTLLEVLVAVGILGIGIVGVLGVFSASVQAAGRAARLEEAVCLAQNELELAVVDPVEQLEPKAGKTGRYQWTVTYAEKAHAVVAATVTVEWSEQGRPNVYRLSRLFLPRR